MGRREEGWTVIPFYRSWTRFWTWAAVVWAFLLLIANAIVRPFGWQWLHYLLIDLVSAFDLWLIGLVLPALLKRKGK